MIYRCTTCARFIGTEGPGLCEKCAYVALRAEQEEITKAAALRDNYPKITEWCDIRGLHTEWKCPKGCPDAEGENDTTICDEGYVGSDQVIEFYCYHCNHKEKYKLKLQLIGGQ